MVTIDNHEERIQRVPNAGLSARRQGGRILIAPTVYELRGGPVHFFLLRARTGLPVGSVHALA